MFETYCFDTFLIQYVIFPYLILIGFMCLTIASNTFFLSLNDSIGHIGLTRHKVDVKYLLKVHILSPFGQSHITCERRGNNICLLKLKALFQSCCFTSCLQRSRSDLTVIACFIIVAAVICFCIPVCASQGQLVTESVSVWPIAV